MNRQQLYISTFIAILIGAALAKLFSLLGINKGISTIIIGLLISFILLYKKSKNIKAEVNLNNKLLPTLELLDQGKVDEFIQKNEEVLKGIDNPAIKLKVILFIIVGYEKKKDYKTPIKLLLDIDKSKLTKEDKVVLNATLAVMNFKSKNKEEAIKIMNLNKDEFSKYRGTYKEPGFMVSYADILKLSSENKTNEAILLIEKIRKNTNDKAFEKEYKNLCKKL